MSSEIVRFPRLDDTNYPTWSIMMEAELIRKGLWTNIIDMIVPTAGKTDDEIEAAVTAKIAARKPEKMAETRAEIILQVEPGQLAHMRSRDPIEIWRSLRSVHRARGFATSLALRRSFLTSQKSDLQTMSSWIGDIQSKAFTMEEAGVPVTEQDKILALTMGLPSEFDAVIINFDSTPSDQLTFDHVVTRLLNEETRQTSETVRKSSRKVSDEKEVAYAAHSSTRSRRPLSEITCFHCQKKGHYRSTCPDRAEKSSAAYAEDADDIW